jgi:protein-tyrosine phosphatase
VGFVDIHSHVLYGLDDGAKTREDSLALLAIARDSGTTDIVATPHANSQYAYRPDVVSAQIADLEAAGGVRIYPGCDFHLQMDNIEDALAHPEKYTINHKGYLLVEFPDLTIFPDTAGLFERLLGAGMVPIVSHPERNPKLRNQVDDLARWVELGCYLQVTAGSFTGVFGRAAKASAFEITGRGLTHIVASDAHDVRFRTPNLREAYAVLAERWREDWIRPLFVENPAAVVAGESIDFEFPVRARASRKWYELWKKP